MFSGFFSEERGKRMSELEKCRHSELLFGAAYYLEYMPYDRLEEDIRMMKHAGMNVLRIAESTWSTLEPKDGIYDFSQIDRVLEIARQENMWVIIGTPTYAIPSWLEKKCPEVMVFDGRKRAKYGHRQQMDIVHPVFRGHAERMIRRLLEHTAGHERVIGFQIDNETKHYGTASKEVQQLFVEYLKEKFGTTERLNQAFGLAYWSNSIADWGDFPDMTGCINGGLAGEFSAFQRGLVTEYLNWQAAIIREYKKGDQFITQNFDFAWKKFGAEIAQDGYSYGVQPDVDHFQAAAAVSIAGTDIYHPTQDELTGAETAFGGDEIRNLKKDNYLVLECQAQGFKNWTPYPGQIRLQGLSHIASGAAAVMYWNWHSIHNGYETYWRGILSHDLAPNPVYHEAAELGELFKKLGRDTLCIQKENKVALVIDNRSLTALEWFPLDKELSYNDVVRWMYDSLYEMNIECDVVEAEYLDTDGYRMIVTPALYSVDEKMTRKLKDFVAAGGVLISSFRSFAADRQLSVYPDKQPHGMTECFGMSYQQFTEPGSMRILGKPVYYFAELLKAEAAESIADYEHKYWGTYAGITRNVYQDGCCYYVGGYVDQEILKDIYRRGLEDAGLEQPAYLFPVIFRSGRNARGESIHYVFHYSQDEKEIVCPYEQAEELVSGRTYRKGDILTLKDWDALILREEKTEQ